MNVCTTTRRVKEKPYHCTLLRAAWGEGNKIKNQTICNVTHLSPAGREAARRALNGEAQVRPEEAFAAAGSIPHGDVPVVLALLRKLRLDRILHACPSRERSLCMVMIVMRLLATARGLSAASTDTTLGSLLDLGGGKCRPRTSMQP